MAEPGPTGRAPAGGSRLRYRAGVAIAAGAGPLTERRQEAPTMLPDDFPAPPHVVTTVWEAVQGDVLLPVAYADWLGASLSVLVAAVHHPQVLAAQQPDTDAHEVATQVLEELPQLLLAARTAEDQQGRAPEISTSHLDSDIRLEDGHLRISPGSELGSLSVDLEIFAKAVLHPEGEDARTARGAIAYSAAAWSREMGLATGALSDPGRRRTAGRTDNHPITAPEPPPVQLSP
ncbi:MAG: hypothetical protein KY447_07245 [Actinobacteria bacterium]|nr:hypothetical protein [Actinomycetota bacterium]